MQAPCPARALAPEVLVWARMTALPSVSKFHRSLSVGAWTGIPPSGAGPGASVGGGSVCMGAAGNGTGGAAEVIADTYGADGVPTLNIFYPARIVRGEPAPADDVAEIAWFGADKLPPASEIAFPCVREVLAH